MFFFFFSSRRRHTRSLCDWSSDVCSSDLRCASRAGTSFLQAGLRFAGGAFGGTFRDLTASNGFNVDLAINRAGDAIMTFNGSMAQNIGSVFRPRNGEFSGVIPAENQATTGTALFNRAVGIDDQGNAAGLWLR